MSNVGTYSYPGPAPPSPNLQFPYPSGSYFMVNRPVAVTTFAVAAGRIYYTPCFLSLPVPLQSIGFKVSSAGAAGKVGRLGRFDLNDRGLPGNKIVDYGTGLVDAAVDVSIPTGDVLPTGWFYIAFVSDGTPTMRSVGTPLFMLPGTSIAGAIDQTNYAYYETPGGSTLPATAGIGVGTNQNGVIPVGRVA